MFSGHCHTLLENVHTQECDISEGNLPPGKAFKMVFLLISNFKEFILREEF